jgi:BirA family transcriptional regulator, biotin operon repressor / biotin---[acetyl-CoA-carboxylase] ligase
LRPENVIGEPFTELSEVDSSNNYAMAKAQAHLAAHGSTWFAWYQKAGKGQRGKNWNAERGQNIMMSCVVEPGLLSIDNQFILSVMVALACHDFFSTYAGDETKIKWPNDIYWRDRKAGGILIENILKGKEWKFAIIGIGININQTLFLPNLPNPVSLKQITGKTFNVIDLAKQLCTLLEKRWQQLKTKPRSELMSEYSSLLYKRDRQVTFKKDNAFFEAKVTGVSDKGNLLIDTGVETEIPFGAVEWIIG